MKKVININLASRVIPIEDTAYDMLSQYLNSLRSHFAGEEGRDEIMSDIEGRIAEIFSEKIKKGANCISDEDVAAVIASMGRPEDFEEAEPTPAGNTATNNSSYTVPPPGAKRFYRDENDKIIGGVCSGLAAYLNIDPAVVRILFVLFGFTGLGVFTYIVLWIAIPSASVAHFVRKRLYRDQDEKVIAGVCSGLANYFNINVGWLRLIFLLPIIIAFVSNFFESHWGLPFRFWSNGGFGSFFLAYLVLWIVVPPAKTAAEKLEMRGEKVDIQNIKNTIMSDLEGFKSRAKSWGTEVKSSVQQGAGTFSSEAIPVVRKTSRGLGYAIGILFKAFAYFLLGIVGLVIFAVLTALFIAGIGILPFTHFLISGFWGSVYVWGTLLLFIGVPLIALLTTLIRRVMGLKKGSKYLSYTFSVLWFFGWLSLMLLVKDVTGYFRSRSGVEETVQLSNPSVSRLYITAVDRTPRSYDYDEESWWDIKNNGQSIFYGKNNDSARMYNVRIQIEKSKDSLFHVYTVRFSRGNSVEAAKELAKKIEFPIEQKDSLLQLPYFFGIGTADKFRNQQVLVVVEVPVGKKIAMSRTLNDYSWFNVSFNDRGRWDENDWTMTDGEDYKWETGIEYIMTPEGLKRLASLDPEALKRGEYKMKRGSKISIEGNIDEIEIGGSVEKAPALTTPPPAQDDQYRYRYDKNNSSQPEEKNKKSDGGSGSGGEPVTETYSAIPDYNPVQLMLHIIQR